MKSLQQKKKFYNLIDHYIQYGPYRSIIYSICYPTYNRKFPEPIIGWSDSYKITEKYYFDDVFFHLHMYIASKENTRECSKNRERFASNCSRTSELMFLLAHELQEYVSLDILKLLEGDDLLIQSPSTTTVRSTSTYSWVYKLLGLKYQN